MKVVLFCGGQGMRIREYSERDPEADGADRLPADPVAHHAYYAHYGHTDFISAWATRASHQALLPRYNEALSNDFVLSNGGQSVELLNSDIEDWRITFVDTGLHANIGQRLQGRPAASRGRGGLPRQLRRRADRPAAAEHRSTISTERDNVATFLCVRPSQTFHVVDIDEDGAVAGIQPATARTLDQRRLLRLPPRDLRLPARRRGAGRRAVPAPDRSAASCIAYRHEGFWVGMDTFKDKQQLEDALHQGRAPWAVWTAAAAADARPAAAPQTVLELTRRLGASADRCAGRRRSGLAAAARRPRRRHRDRLRRHAAAAARGDAGARGCAGSC